MASRQEKKTVKLNLFELPVLEGNNSIERKEWLESWQRGISIVNTLLTLPFDVFWAKLIEEPKLMLFLDSFLEEFPRFWDEDQLNVYFNADATVHSVATDMYRKILLMLCRASTFKEHGKEISEMLYKRTIYDNRIFTIERLLNMISVYWKDNEAAVRSIIERTVGVQMNYLKDLTNTVNKLSNFISTIPNTLKSLSNSLKYDTGVYEELNSLLSLCNDILYSLPNLVALCSSTIPLKDACFAFCISIPNFAEVLEDVVFPKIGDNFLSAASSSARSDSFCMLDHVRNSALGAFHSMIKLQVDDDRLCSALQNALAYEKFIFYYNLEYPIENLFSLVPSDDSSKKYINEILEEVASKQKDRILKHLEREGLLADLGSPVDPSVESQIENLVELLPHFSRQFVHLCLRNYGYDLERVTNALLDTVLLPLDLRALMDVELVSRQPLAIQIIKNSTKKFEIAPGESSHETATQESKKGLISMKPIIKEINSEKDLSRKDIAQDEISSKHELESILSHLKLRNDDILHENAQSSQRITESLVELISSTEKFCVPEAAEVALRPSYEKYMYEEEGSFPWNVYDDEYDDTTDDYQSYSVDVTQEVLPDVEPNRNRELLEEEEEVDTNESEDKLYFGGGKRAREKTVKGKAKKTGVSQMPVAQDGEHEVVQVISGEAILERSDDNTGTGRGRGRQFWNQRRSGGGDYTEGRQRRLKEKHKGADRRRGADKKQRSGMF